MFTLLFLRKWTFVLFISSLFLAASAHATRDIPAETYGIEVSDHPTDTLKKIVSVWDLDYRNFKTSVNKVFENEDVLGPNEKILKAVVIDSNGLTVFLLKGAGRMASMNYSKGASSSIYNSYHIYDIAEYEDGVVAIDRNNGIIHIDVNGSYKVLIPPSDFVLTNFGNVVRISIIDKNTIALVSDTHLIKVSLPGSNKGSKAQVLQSIDLPAAILASSAAVKQEFIFAESFMSGTDYVWVTALTEDKSYPASSLYRYAFMRIALDWTSSSIVRKEMLGQVADSSVFLDIKKAGDIVYFTDGNHYYSDNVKTKAMIEQTSSFRRLSLQAAGIPLLNSHPFRVDHPKQTIDWYGRSFRVYRNQSSPVAAATTTPGVPNWMPSPAVAPLPVPPPAMVVPQGNANTQKAIPPEKTFVITQTQTPGLSLEVKIFEIDYAKNQARSVFDAVNTSMKVPFKQIAAIHSASKAVGPIYFFCNGYELYRQKQIGKNSKFEEVQKPRTGDWAAIAEGSSGSIFALAVNSKGKIDLYSVDNIGNTKHIHDLYFPQQLSADPEFHLTLLDQHSFVLSIDNTIQVFPLSKGITTVSPIFSFQAKGKIKDIRALNNKIYFSSDSGKKSTIEEIDIRSNKLDTLATWSGAPSSFAGTSEQIFDIDPLTATLFIRDGDLYGAVSNTTSKLPIWSDVFSISKIKAIPGFTAAASSKANLVIDHPQRHHAFYGRGFVLSGATISPSAGSSVSTPTNTVSSPASVAKNEVKQEYGSGKIGAYLGGSDYKGMFWYEKSEKADALMRGVFALPSKPKERVKDKKYFLELIEKELPKALTYKMTRGQFAEALETTTNLKYFFKDLFHADPAENQGAIAALGYKYQNYGVKAIPGTASVVLDESEVNQMAEALSVSQLMENGKPKCEAELDPHAKALIKKWIK